MKKSACAIIVMLLSLIGAQALASEFDVNVKRVASQINDTTGNDNHGSKGCGSKVDK